MVKAITMNVVTGQGQEDLQGAGAAPQVGNRLRISGNIGRSSGCQAARMDGSRSPRSAASSNLAASWSHGARAWSSMHPPRLVSGDHRGKHAS